MAIRKRALIAAGAALLLLRWSVGAVSAQELPLHAERGYYWHAADQSPGTLARALYEAKGEELWDSEEPLEFRIALHERLNDAHTFFRPGKPADTAAEKRLAEAARRRYEVARNPEVRALILWHRLLDHATTMDAWRHADSPMVRGAAMAATWRRLDELEAKERAEFLGEATAWLTGEGEVDLKYVVSGLTYRLPSIREHLRAVPVEARWRLMKRLAWYLESPTPAIRRRAAWAMARIDVPGGNEFLLAAICQSGLGEAAETADYLLDFRRLPMQQWDCPSGLRLLRHLMASGGVGTARHYYKELRGPRETARVLLSTQLGSFRPSVVRLNEMGPQILEELAAGWRPADYTDAEVEALRAKGLNDEIADALLARPVRSLGLEN